MSAVTEREEAMRMLLAEVAPAARFRVEPHPVGSCVTWSSKRPDVEAVRKAVYLSALKCNGADTPVKCRAHFHIGTPCDRIPVAWALLGHTCGRSW